MISLKNFSYSILYLNKKYFFVIKKKYFLIPSSFFLKYSNQNVSLITLPFSLYLNSITHFEKWMQNSFTLFVKKLCLKGLGLKVKVTDDLKYLEFKLGFSHLVKIIIPEGKLKIAIYKNILSLKSENLIFLGNFIYKIRNLKKPNIYNGKGLFYKNEKIRLKEIKKT